MLNSKILLVLLTLLVLSPVPVFGTHCDPNINHPGVLDVQLPCPIKDTAGVITFMNKVFGFLFSVVIVISTIFILYAAFLYITARGADEEQKRAKTILIYAITGLIVAAVAYGIPRVVTQFFA